VSEPIPPILIDGDGHFRVYPTIAIACQDVEAVDVNDGLYEAFDSEGRVLSLVVHENRVALEVSPNSQPDAAELEGRLRKHIEAVGTARVGVANLDSTPLPVLLQALISFELGYGESRTSFWRRSEAGTRAPGRNFWGHRRK
jgi:hypothetical protein